MYQKLMTKEIERKLPALYSNEGKKPSETKIIVKFFNPYGAGTWYITEYDGRDAMFGLCCIQEPELGYVSFSEIKSLKINLGGVKLPLERDMHLPRNFTLADAMRYEKYPHLDAMEEAEEV